MASNGWILFEVNIKRRGTTIRMNSCQPGQFTLNGLVHSSETRHEIIDENSREVMRREYGGR
jgi:hypothetical protein